MQAGAESYPRQPGPWSYAPILTNRRPEQYREISACPHIRNTTHYSSNHRQPCQTVTTRMSPHTQHNRTHAHHAHRRSQPHHPHAPTYESRHIGRQTLAEHHQSSWPVSAGMHNPTHQPTNPVTKASNHRDPHDTTCATRRITYPVSANPAICERILTQSPTGSTASDKDSGAP